MDKTIRIVRPKQSIEVPDDGYDLFFLAGPIRGAGDWQTEACRLLIQNAVRPCVIAVPCRWDDNHSLHDYFLTTEIDKEKYPRQTIWEREYLEKASHSGGVIFWLAKQVGDRELSAGPYGRDTMGELGEWRGRRIHDPSVQVVIGADMDEMNQYHFGISVALCNWMEAVGSNRIARFHQTLKETIQAGIGREFI